MNRQEEQEYKEIKNPFFVTSNGLMLFETEDQGRMVFSLEELSLNIKYRTMSGALLRRVSDDEFKFVPLESGQPGIIKLEKKSAAIEEDNDDDIDQLLNAMKKQHEIDSQPMDPKQKAKLEKAQKKKEEEAKKLQDKLEKTKVKR